MASNSNQAILYFMFVLPMTAFPSYHEPTILFNNFYNFSYFHLD